MTALLIGYPGGDPVGDEPRIVESRERDPTDGAEPGVGYHAIASRDLPQPPGPVRVTSRCSACNCRTARISRTRPIRVVIGTGIGLSADPGIGWSAPDQARA